MKFPSLGFGESELQHSAKRKTWLEAARANTGSARRRERGGGEIGRI
jgi:hypothetical protein